MLTKITDYGNRAIALLPEQFKNKPNIASLLQVISTLAQDIENVGFTLQDGFKLSQAIGTQLDVIGKILGEPRSGRSDDEYRIALNLKIAINTSSGTPESIINVVASVTNSVSVQLLEAYPAKIQLFYDGAVVIVGAGDIIKQITPAGVEITITTSGGASPFVFSSDADGIGFSAIGTNDGGSFSGVV